MPRAVTKPDIEISEEVSEEKIENEQEKEKPLQFGDDKGDFGDLFNTSVLPRIISPSKPEYPSSMRKAGITGVVLIELGIETDGSVVFGKIIRTMGEEFDLAVIKWSKTLMFYPALDKNKEPIRCRIRLPVRFKLED